MWWNGATPQISARISEADMKKRDAFSSYHPIINFFYFFLVIAFSMCLMHPIALGISLFCAFCYAVELEGKKAVLFSLKFALPMMLIASLINPAFSHGGVTILCYLPSGNPLTLESILYGLGAAAMLAAILLWFRCYTHVLTSDKFIYLFGRIIPALSLVLSMALRFVPRFKTQLELVRQAQHSIGRDVSNGSIFRRVKNATVILSIMVTWSLENAIETADSMKSRGYGLHGRTAFSIYRFDDRDKTVLAWLLFCGIYLFCGTLAGGLQWRYFPRMKGVLTEPFPLSLLFVYFCLCITPVILNRREVRKWHSSKSEI